MERMKGKYCIISGGNSGIGAATAKIFAQEGAAGIAILDLKKEGDDFDAYARELCAMGTKAIAIPCNVVKPEQVQAAVEQAVAEFGRIDSAVFCAGILDGNGSVPFISDELWNRTISINQTGMFNCCREVLKVMEKQGEGAIVNISSAAGVSGNSGSAYSTSKFAVVGLTKNIAMQYTGTNIRCNTILPGPTHSAMTDRPPEEMDENGLPKDPNFDVPFTQICQRHVDTEAVGFMPAEEQAKAILFLASDESRCINGQWLGVDKGFYLSRA